MLKTHFLSHILIYANVIYFTLCVLCEIIIKEWLKKNTIKDSKYGGWENCLTKVCFAGITKVLDILTLRKFLVSSLVSKSWVRLTQELLVYFPESLTRQNTLYLLLNKILNYFIYEGSNPYCYSHNHRYFIVKTTTNTYDKSYY